MTYISLYLFFIFVFYLFLEIESFTPAGRLSHSSVLVGSKLYFFGGVLDNKFCSNEVFYLDVSQQFNMASPPWNDLTTNAGLPIRSCWGAASLSDTNNEQNIYLFGGVTRDKITNNDTYTSFVYKFNLKSGQWTTPTTIGNTPERRREIRAVNDNSGKIYIFGGTNFNLVPPPLVFFNDMAIFNAVDLSWVITNSPNAPTRRSSYSATLLSNGVIVYIGGYGPIGDGLLEADMSQISLFDTKSLTWSVQTAKLINRIDGRVVHTAVLAPNGKIIIYGGHTMSVGAGYAQVTPDIAVLNTETSPFEWTIPSVSSNIGSVPSLTAHTANLVEDYMIVTFGNITQPNGLPLPSKNTNVYIMDIRNYTWVNTFNLPIKPSNPSTSTTSAKPTNTSGNQPTDANNNQLTTMKVVIGTMSGIVGTAILMTAGIFGYKWYKRHQSANQDNDNVMRIHGNAYPI